MEEKNLEDLYINDDNFLEVKIENNDNINRKKVMGYINILMNSAMGKKKCLEYLLKYVEKI